MLNSRPNLPELGSIWATGSKDEHSAAIQVDSDDRPLRADPAFPTTHGERFLEPCNFQFQYDEIAQKPRSQDLGRRARPFRRELECELADTNDCVASIRQSFRIENSQRRRALAKQVLRRGGTFDKKEGSLIDVPDSSSRATHDDLQRPLIAPASMPILADENAWQEYPEMIANDDWKQEDPEMIADDDCKD